MFLLLFPGDFVAFLVCVCVCRGVFFCNKAAERLQVRSRLDWMNAVRVLDKGVDYNKGVCHINPLRWSYTTITRLTPCLPTLSPSVAPRRSPNGFDTRRGAAQRVQTEHELQLTTFLRQLCEVTYRDRKYILQEVYFTVFTISIPIY